MSRRAAREHRACRGSPERRRVPARAHVVHETGRLSPARCCEAWQGAPRMPPPLRASASSMERRRVRSDHHLGVPRLPPRRRRASEKPLLAPAMRWTPMVWHLRLRQHAEQFEHRPDVFHLPVRPKALAAAGSYKMFRRSSKDRGCGISFSELRLFTLDVLGTRLQSSGDASCCRPED